MNREQLKEAFQDYIAWMLPTKQDLKEMGLITAYMALVYLLLGIASLFL